MKAIASKNLRLVEEEWSDIKDGPGTLTEAELARVAFVFIDPSYKTLPQSDAEFLRLN